MSSTTRDDPSASDPARQFLKLFSAVMLPMFMAAVDQTLLATATPVMAEELGSLRDTSWIAVGYLLAAASTTPLYGRMGDRYGRANVLRVALGVFALGSVACASAQSMGMLVLARVLQGIGGGGLMTLSQALIGELVTPRERARYQGYFAAMFSIASIGGPVIGGLVVSHASWRWLFLANVPLAAFAVWRLGVLPRGHHQAVRRGQDYAGIVLFSGAIVSLLFWLSSAGHRFAWASGTSVALGASSLVLFGLLVWHERRHPHPFLPLELLRLHAVSFCALTTSLFAACMFAMIFFLPIYLQLGHSTTAATSGLLLLPLTVGMVTGSTVSGRIVARTGVPRWVPVIGMSLSSVGLALLGTLGYAPAIVAGLGVVVGLGFGTVMPMMQVTVQTVAGRERLGAATSIVSLSRSLGAATGTAMFGALVFALMPETDLSRFAEHVRGASVDSVQPAFHTAFLAAAVVAALAALAASRVPRVELR
ncbi:MAG: MFS transporter [Betaproteobacteria bacterium]|nr:MFS transporter [Betaproteobacteria bacterium]